MNNVPGKFDNKSKNKDAGANHDVVLILFKLVENAFHN